MIFVVIAALALASLLLGAAVNRWWALGAAFVVFLALGMSDYGDDLEGDLGWDFVAIFGAVSAAGIVVGIATRRGLRWAMRKRGRPDYARMASSAPLDVPHRAGERAEHRSDDL